MRKMLLSVLVLLAVPASASAATVIPVNDQADAPLESGATSCESTDAGGCTLRAAVEYADEQGGQWTIELSEGTYQETLLPAEPLWIEDSDVTILGKGQGRTTIEGQPQSSVLDVEEDGSLTLEDLTVTGGEAYYGGGVYVEEEGALTLRDAQITKNAAEYEGGGIYAEPSSSVTIEESTISANTAGYDGGGVNFKTGGYECGLATARHAARGKAARPDVNYGDLGSGLVVVRSTIEGNTVEDGYGGGIYAAPSYCDLVASSAFRTKRATVSLNGEEATLLVLQSAITGNTAASEEYGDPYYGIGGGIYEEAFEVDDPVIDSTIAENVATNTGGGVAVAGGAQQLVSDTIADNRLEPLEENRIQARSDAKPAVLGQDEAGANLATPVEGDAWIGLRNTIVSEPTGTEVSNCAGRIGSLEGLGGYNLDYPSVAPEGEGELDACGMSSEEHDLVGVDPRLDPAGLQENGGLTKTIALTAESPAIGYVPIKGDCEEEGTGPALEEVEGKPSAIDQRGEPRPGLAGKECDIGAYEYQGAPPAKEVTTQQETKPTAKTEVLSVKITSPAQCASKRDIVIHIQNVKQFGVVSAVVSIDGKARRTLRGRRLRTAIDLVGLPKGTFTVEILAKTRGGRTLHGERVYHTCHTKLPGHLRLRL